MCFSGFALSSWRKLESWAGVAVVMHRKAGCICLSAVHKAWKEAEVIQGVICISRNQHWTFD